MSTVSATSAPRIRFAGAHASSGICVIALHIRVVRGAEKLNRVRCARSFIISSAL
ncbi:MAG: hypothetical protein ACLP01_05620 [Solirubrobacteraceae bacterium]